MDAIRKQKARGSPSTSTRDRTRPNDKMFLLRRAVAPGTKLALIPPPGTLGGSKIYRSIEKVCQATRRKRVWVEGFKAISLSRSKSSVGLGFVLQFRGIDHGLGFQ